MVESIVSMAEELKELHDQLTADFDKSMELSMEAANRTKRLKNEARRRRKSKDPDSRLWEFRAEVAREHTEAYRDDFKSSRESLDKLSADMNKLEAMMRSMLGILPEEDSE